MSTVLVTGAGGFIGGHLVKALVGAQHDVTAVDIKSLHQWWQISPDAQNVVADLRVERECQRLIVDADLIYHLAADMGGIGYIALNDWACSGSIRITLNLLQALEQSAAVRLVYTSSACVYPRHLQSEAPVPLREDLVYPADPEGGYGWEKLYSEQLLTYAGAVGIIEPRIARLFNVYGPRGAYAGGREKAPAALCRKVIEAARSNDDAIVVWGNGTQVRSYLYVDDCIRALIKLASVEKISGPVNIASEELISVDDITEAIATMASTRVKWIHQPDAPTGVHKRIPEISRAKRELAWTPEVDLSTGLAVTYSWIREEMAVP